MSTAAAIGTDIREWMYLDKVNSSVAPSDDPSSALGDTSAFVFQPKGPFTAQILLKLLEKGLGISAQTLIWRPGMAEWQEIGQLEPYRTKIDFLSGTYIIVHFRHLYLPKLERPLVFLRRRQ